MTSKTKDFDKWAVTGNNENKKLAKIENIQYKLFMMDVNVVKTKFVTPVITFLKVIHTTVIETYSSLLKITEYLIYRPAIT